MGIRGLVDQSDFISFKFQISLINLTTNTTINAKGVSVRGTLLHPNFESRELVQILEVTADGMSFSVPTFSCAVGHNLRVTIKVLNASTVPFEFEVPCKVIETEKTTSTSDLIIVKDEMTDGPGRKELIRTMEKKQSEISKFLMQVKGI